MTKLIEQLTIRRKNNKFKISAIFFRLWLHLLSMLLLVTSLTTLRLCAQEIKNPQLPTAPLHFFNENTNTPNFVIYISGDGGWNTFSQKLIQKLAENNMLIVVLDSKKYFWDGKTPASFTKDIESIIAYYKEKLHKHKLTLIGYSFGADVLSFVPELLSPKSAQMLQNTVLISPSASTDYEVRLLDLFGSNTVERKYKVKEKILSDPQKKICIFGREEDNGIKQFLLRSGTVKCVQLPGGHEYEDNYKILTEAILPYLD